MKTLTTAQIIACSTYLNEWPDDIYFHDILHLIVDGGVEEGLIELHDEYEEWDLELIVEEIKRLERSIQLAINEELQKNGGECF